MRIGIALAAAIALASASFAQASAQGRPDRAAEAELGKLRERGMKEAPALVQAKGYGCTVADALFLGEADVIVDGKPVKGKKKPLYEVTCQDAIGFIFGDPDPAPLNCMMLSTLAARQAAAGQKVDVTQCRLPANMDGRGAFPLLQKAGVSCTPAKARWFGYREADQTYIYEVACTDSSSYVVFAPDKAAPSSTNCVEVNLSEGVACQYFTKEQAVAWVGALASKSGRACQLTNARMVGEKKSGGNFYEVACADKTGFMVETAANGAFSKALDCAQAETIGGGCSLTQVATAGETEDLPIYARKIKEIGHPCAPSKYRSLGVDPDDAQRELVELACSNQAEGVFAAVPIGAAGRGETFNCARAEAREQICRLTDKKATFPQLSNRMKAKGATCNVRDSRGIGQTDEKGDVVEVACDGGPGYMLIFIPHSEALSQVMPCAQAKDVAGGCKLQ